MRKFNGDSWGRIPRASCSRRFVRWRSDKVFTSKDESLLAHGLGRSYGDACVNEGGTLLETRWLDKIIAFDTEKGVLRVEAGASLGAILSVIVPHGWFLPVVPGTRFVTIGGAIANDIHGKNHHRAGTFGAHVRCFELQRSSGERLVCDPAQNEKLFRATIGGLGLTGFIVWAEIQLKPIESPFIADEEIRFGSLDEFFSLSTASESCEYTVAWLDCVSSGEYFGRGIFMRGDHAARGAVREKTPTQWARAYSFSPLATMPIDAPSWALNRLTVGAFNTCYYHKNFTRHLKRVVPYGPFFFPLDAVLKWNRVYGSSGFFQFQCVIPSAHARPAVRELLERTVATGEASFLAVLKEFGAARSPGLLSFPRPGVTLCLDFPNRGARTVRLMSDLETVVRESGGALYPAKDGLMSPESFAAAYPTWRELETLRDPAFSSSFWRRVTSTL